MSAPENDLLTGAGALGVVLASQRVIVDAMLALAQRQQDAIVAGDVEALTNVVDEQQQMVDHLNSLETERMTALVAIATAIGLDDTEGLTLTQVAAALPAPLGTALATQGQTLRAQAEALRQAQDLNERLIESSKSLVDRWLQYLRTVLSGSLYNASGAAGELPGGRALDRSA
jgi:flagellar biosynthesis/type III secretory pathway chaperone